MAALSIKDKDEPWHQILYWSLSFQWCSEEMHCEHRTLKA